MNTLKWLSVQRRAARESLGSVSELMGMFVVGLPFLLLLLVASFSISQAEAKSADAESSQRKAVGNLMGGSRGGKVTVRAQPQPESKPVPIAPPQVKLPRVSTPFELPAVQLIGYQFGTYHYFDVSTCANPRLVTEGSSPVILDYLDAAPAVVTVYADAIDWIRRLCGVQSTTPVQIEAEIRILGSLKARLQISDIERNAAGKDLYWSERVSVRSFQRLEGSIESMDAAVQDFFDVGSHMLLAAKEQQPKYYEDFYKLDWNELELSGRHTVQLELARLEAPKVLQSYHQSKYKRRGDATNRIPLAYSDWTTKCPDSLSLASRAADSGNPIAAYEVVKCTVKLATLSTNVDFALAAAERYPQALFYLAKALSAGVSAAGQYQYAMSGYEQEINNYVGVIQANGDRYPFDQFLEDYGLAEGEQGSVRAPSYAEIRPALNNQVLPKMCSKGNLFFGGDSSGNSRVTALFSESVSMVNNWCVTENFAVRIDLRFGRIVAMDCDEQGGARFSCSVAFNPQCRIESARSTAPGNDMICSLYGRIPAKAEVVVVRLPGGGIEVENYRPRRAG